MSTSDEEREAARRNASYFVKLKAMEQKSKERRT
jgi:hypothetical protein